MVKKGLFMWASCHVQRRVTGTYNLVCRGIVSCTGTCTDNADKFFRTSESVPDTTVNIHVSNLPV